MDEKLLYPSVLLNALFQRSFIVFLSFSFFFGIFAENTTYVMNPHDSEVASAMHQRMRDALRLAQTRMQNLEENLKRLRSLQGKLYSHQQLNAELDINSKHLFALNKEYASMSEEADEMDRFETFESVMAPFLRMQMLEQDAEENRRNGNELEQEMRRTADEIEELRKNLMHSRDITKTADAKHRDLCHTVDECSRHDGACAVIEDSVKRMTQLLALEEDRLDSIKSMLDSRRTACAEYERKLELFNARRHTMESHESMLGRADLLLMMLQRLEELAENLSSKTLLYERNADEQQRCNEELARIISRHDDIGQQIQSLQDEIRIHRANTSGIRSYEVQERVMALKSRLLLLNAAQSLWRRISTGYSTIEEKTQLINSLRLEIEHDMKAEQELTVSVATLKRLASDKEYSLNMSKSQSLISLRSDLVEGTACSVCGATHHPYHSDTMQDQYKLISDFRSDFESLSGELQGQEKQLSMLHDKLTSNLGRQVAEQQNLEVVRLRQSQDVKEWRVFAQLDPTFTDCSASTDSDARMATIRQLLDNAQRDLQGAEAELGEFNYHTAQITTLSGRISQLEDSRSEIDIRMNEAKSRSRILASQEEKLALSRKLAQEKYHRHYDLLQQEITLPEWFRAWQNNSEGLYMNIKQMASDWQEVNAAIAETGRLLSEDSVRCEMLDAMRKQCEHGVDILREELRLSKSKYGELHEQRQALLSGVSTGEALDHSLDTYLKAQEEHTSSIEKLHRLALRRKEQEGAYGNVRHMGEVLDEKVRAQKNLVDLWIRSYNASHPPVQYGELNNVLTRNIDWNDKRKRIRENRMDTLLQQQKVKELQAEIIALEVDTGTLTTSQLTEKQLATELQIEQHEASLREVTMQIAKLKIELGL